VQHLGNTTPAARAPRYSWYVVAVLLLASISSNIDRQILSLLVIPIRRDLGLTLTQYGSLVGLPFAVFFSVMGLPIARAADRGNRRNIITAGIALWSLATATCALAGTFWRLLLARIGVGVGEAALQPPAASLLADYFPRERLGGAMGVYSMGIFVGSGLAYFIGGWVVGLVSAQESWTWPLLGSIRPWQTVFVIVGAPGLAVAVLIALTVREPQRRGTATVGVPIAALTTYVMRNARTFATLCFGFALSATVNYGIAAWLALFLVQKHGWPVSRAGMVQGSLTMTIGALGVVLGGRLADRLTRAGKTDGALRVGIIGALGMLVSATAYPFAGSAGVAVAWLVLVNFFAAFPWGAASAAAVEIVPQPMRAQSAALFLFVLNLLSYAVGPVAVAAITDHVFHNDAALPYSLAIVNVIGMSGAIALLTFGMPAYRRTLATREHWISPV
jgi:MFS family permease